MNIIDNLTKHLKEVTGMNNEYFVLIVVSLIVFIGVKVINKIINILEPILIISILIIITSYAVDNSYNPFLYFRF